MKDTRPQKKNRGSDYFAFFKKVTVETMSFLVTDYGFQLESIVDQMPDCAIEYRNETTIVVVTYEWTSEVWITLKQVPPGSSANVEGIGLDLLIRQRCPANFVVKNNETEWTNEKIKMTLSNYADALKGCASDSIP